MAKRLLIVTTSGMTVVTILKGLPLFLKDEYEVTVITSGQQYFDQIQKNEDVVPVHVPMLRGINPFFDIYSLFLMIKQILQLKPDVIHSYTPKAGLISMVSAWICRVPVRIHTFTGLVFPSRAGIQRKILRFIDQIICFCATTVVPEGLGVKKELLFHRVTKKPLDLIGNGNIAGINIDFYSRECSGVEPAARALASRLGITDSTFVFIYVGRLNRDKGIDELVKAFVLLGVKNTRLLLVGDIDSSAPITDATLKSIDSNPAIIRLGFLSDIRPALYLSNVLVLASYREGFPNVLMQAGAMELPVITTLVSGADEIIKDGVTGFIVPPRNIEALKKEMQTVLRMDKQSLKIMGENARVRVGELFEQGRFRRLLVNFYRKQIDGVKDE